MTLAGCAHQSSINIKQGGRSPSQGVCVSSSGWQGQPRAFRVSGGSTSKCAPESRSSHCLRGGFDC